MSMTMRHLTRWNDWNIRLGSGLWFGLFSRSVVGQQGPTSVAFLLLLAFLVITPLVLRLVVLPAANLLPGQLVRVAIVVQPCAALCACAAFLPMPPILSVIGASVWLVFTMLLALLGALLAWQQFRHIDALCCAVALIYVPIGAIWFLMARAGIAPLGFSPEITMFTAAHFHYIPLVALTMTGLVGQALRPQRGIFLWKLYCEVAGGMLVLPLLVAIGITLTQLTGMRLVETLATILLALAVFLLSFILLRCIVGHITAPLARWLLVISGSAVFVSMSAAIGYVLGNATGAWVITYPQMVLIHGWINAVLFGACGLFGWVAQRDPSPAGQR